MISYFLNVNNNKHRLYFYIIDENIPSIMQDVDFSMNFDLPNKTFSHFHLHEISLIIMSKFKSISELYFAITGVPLLAFVTIHEFSAYFRSVFEQVPYAKVPNVTDQYYCDLFIKYFS